MKSFKIIISGFLAVAIALISCTPAYAAIDPGTLIGAASVLPDFFDWIIGTGEGGINAFLGAIGVKDVCSGAGGTLNNRHVFEPMQTTVNGKLGNYYICKNCGKSAGEVYEPAYQDHVSELPAQGYNSDGSLFIAAQHDYLFPSSYNRAFRDYFVGCEHCPDGYYQPSFLCTTDCTKNLIIVTPKSGSSSFLLEDIFAYFSLIAPLDGYYTVLKTPEFSGRYSNESGESIVYNRSDSFSPKVGTRTFYSAGSKISSYIWYHLPLTTLSYLSFQATNPVYKVEPVGTLDSTYTPDTRPTVITGDYGIVDNQGIATVVKDCTIVNETTNNYYNPATGQNYPISDWSYDYPSREYTITTDSNNTVTVTYGDEYVTIQEGDTVYNIYYVVDGFGEEQSPCEHDWQTGTRTDPTCTQPGQQPYTCQKCGETKSDTLPALGHNWQVKQSVTTQYDDSGQLLQEGYTIYECSRCGEQYKTGSGSGPPSSGGGGPSAGDTPGEDGGSVWDKLGNLLGTVITGISGFLGAVLGKLLDALTFLAEIVLGGLGSVVDVVLSLFDSVPQLFGGFLAFLSAVFPFIPEEMITLLTFGLAAIVFIGILKAVRK